MLGRTGWTLLRIRSHVAFGHFLFERALGFPASRAFLMCRLPRVPFFSFVLITYARTFDEAMHNPSPDSPLQLIP